ncbi:MAG: hypothetical protein ACTHM8_14710, partial [Sphingomonas sp.]
MTAQDSVLAVGWRYRVSRNDEELIMIIVSRPLFLRQTEQKARFRHRQVPSSRPIQLTCNRQEFVPMTDTDQALIEAFDAR